MRYAVVDSGLGLLGCAAALLDADPAAELVLALDPDGMPYGARSAADVTSRVRALAADAAAFGPDVLVVACNTASVHGLDALRADLEPGVPVVGTVPAIKPAALGGRPLAVWATPRTTGSAYQRGLIEQFAAGLTVHEVACPDLAEAIERADREATLRAVRHAVATTPTDVSDVVLGCTHYPLVAADLREAFGRPVRLHDSAAAVAAQAVRRAAGPAAGATAGPTGGPTAGPTADRHGGGAAGPVLVAVRESGRPAHLPERALHYAEGRRLAAVAAGRAG